MKSAQHNRPGSLAIIVPVFNEKQAIGDVLDTLCNLRGQSDWEIIVVDDASSDGSSAIIETFRDRVTALRHTSNRGYGASLKTGILATRAENVIFVDGDGQHDAGDIPRFVSELANHEFVFGSRKGASGVPGIRKPGKWLLKQICEFLAAQRIPDINCGFRGGRRKLYMRMLDLLPDGFSFSTTSLMYALKSRCSMTFLSIECKPRIGTSTVRIVHDGLKTVLLALRLSMLFDPMRAFGYPAVALIFLGVIYQVYIFAAFGLHIEGGSILSILTGVLLFHFGLLGDQIASLRKEISSHTSLFWEEKEGRSGDR